MTTMATSKKSAKASPKKAPARKARIVPVAPAAEAAPTAPQEADAAVAAPAGADWVAKLEEARRKPVEIADGGPAAPAGQTGQLKASPKRRRKGAEQALVEPTEAAPDPVPAEGQEPEAAQAAPSARPPAAVASLGRPMGQATDLSLPEQFLLVAIGPGWDDRMERARAGSQGGAIAGSLLLELALRGHLKVQRDRFQVQGEVADPDLAAVASKVAELGDRASIEAMEKLCKGLPRRIRPWKQRLGAKGLARERVWRHLGVLPRSETHLLDADAQDQLVKRLLRILAGSGNPDAQSILLLALLDAAGLLETLVPSSTLPFNRKRLQALLSGRDTLGYAVDSQMRNVQDLALQTVLQNVRLLQGTR